MNTEKEMKKYIGQKVIGFKFDSSKDENLEYIVEMDSFIGDIGRIISYNKFHNVFVVDFQEKSYEYPAYLVIKQIREKKTTEKYKMLQWYPSLHPEWKNEQITVEQTKDGDYINSIDYQVVPKHEVENNPDFWKSKEEEKPLFVTDDGVEVFDENEPLIVVLLDLKKDYFLLKTILGGCNEAKKNIKVFYHKKNADEYIQEHKPRPLFTTEDGYNVFDGDTYFLISEMNVYRLVARESLEITSGGIRFKHESNTDEYIWRNKLLFSYEDIREYFECEGKFYDVKSIAKERSKQ